MEIVILVFLSAKILFFYLIFYAALTGFFAAMLAVFYQTLQVDKPKWTLGDGIIGTNPGELANVTDLYIFISKAHK